MFNNIGQKIKSLAKVFFWIGVIGSAVSGIVMMTADDEAMIVFGVLTIVFGIMFSWVGNFFIYGFGQLVENSDRMVQLLESGTVSTKRERKAESERAPQPKYAPKPPKAEPKASRRSMEEPQPSEPDELAEIICPHCGEELYVSKEEESGFFCPFCGGKVTAEEIKRSM